MGTQERLRRSDVEDKTAEGATPIFETEIWVERVELSIHI